MAKYFKLAPGQGIFWDPTQPLVENQKLVGDQIKELELTSSVEAAKRNERIIAVDGEELKAYLKKSTGVDAEKASKKSDDLNEKMKAALAKEAEVEAKLKELAEKSKATDEAASDADEKMKAALAKEAEVEAKLKELAAAEKKQGK